MEQVNACDICGDVGVEDKLLICSRCKDGAEHTYCMKVKLDEVPKCEWLCEDCQADVEIEIEKKKLQISRVKAGTVSSDNNVENKVPIKKCQLNGTSSNSNHLDAGILSNTESVTYNVGSTPCSSCLHSLELEVGYANSDDTSTPKVQHGVLGFGSSEAVNTDKTCHDHEQTSGGRSAFNLRSLNGERHSLEKCNHDVSCNFEVKGTSNVAAVNGQSEVIVCDICGDVGDKKKLSVCSRCNDGAQHTYCMQMMIKEVPEEGWLCETCQSELQTDKKNTKLENSQVKIDAFKQALIEVKVNKSANDANIKSSSKDEVDTKYSDNRESKRGNRANLVGQNSPEYGGLSIEVDYRTGSLLTHGCTSKIHTEKGKQTTSQGPTSVAPNALKSMVPPLHGPLSKSISFNSSKIPKVKQLLTDVHLKAKHSKEPSSSIMKQLGPKSTLTMSSSLKKSNFCDPTHKVKTLLKPNSEETRVLYPLKRQNVNNNRGSSMVDSNYVSIAHGQGRKTLGHNEVKNPLSATGPGTISLNRVKTSVDILAPDAARKAVQIPHPSNLDYKLSNPRSMDIPTMPSYLGNKALTFSSQHISPGFEQLAFTPELNHIWQGGFELRRSEGSLEFCDGLQAHLSCSTSPKLIDLATKLPSKFQLEELPRHNVWPVQFQENCPTYDSIDLFFFARDMQSYKNYYSKLVENITKGDLALRGNIETAELLVFASNILSKNYQRWNMSSFLWGVLRVRRNNPVSLPLHGPLMPGCIRSKTAPLENEEQLRIMVDAINCTDECLVAPGVHGPEYPTTAIEYGAAQGDLDKDGNGTPHLLPLVDRHEKKRKIAQGTPNKNKKNFKDQCTKRLVDANEMKPQSSTKSGTCRSVRKEIAQLLELVVQDGAEEETDEHYYATQLLMEKKYRDMFLTFRTPTGRLKWLRRAWDDRKKH